MNEQTVECHDPISGGRINRGVYAADHYYYDLQMLNSYITRLHEISSPLACTVSDANGTAVLGCVSPIDGSTQIFYSDSSQVEDVNPDKVQKMHRLFGRNWETSVTNIIPIILQRLSDDGLLTAVGDSTDFIGDSPFQKPNRRPQIVVVGSENEGKSTTLNRVCGLPIFPRDRTIATRLAFRLRMITGERQVPTVYTASAGGNSQDREDEVPVSLYNMMPVIYDRMTRLLQRYNAEEGVLATHEIVIEMQHPDLPNIDLLDLPGLILARGQRSDKFKKAVWDMCEKIMDEQTDHSMFMMITAAKDNGILNAQSLELIKTPEQRARCLGVITKVDKKIVDDTSKEEVEGHNPLSSHAHEIYGGPLSEEDRRQVSFGYDFTLIASNEGRALRELGLDQQKVANVQDVRAWDGVGNINVLVKMSDVEEKIFAEHSLHPNLHGMDHLQRKVQDSFNDHIRGSYLPMVRQNFAVRIRGLDRRIRYLGSPRLAVDEGGHAIGDTATIVKHTETLFETYWATLDNILTEWIEKLLQGVSTQITTLNNQFTQEVESMKAHTSVRDSLPRTLTLARKLYRLLVAELEALCAKLTNPETIVELPAQISEDVSVILSTDSSLVRVGRFPNFVQLIVDEVYQKVLANMKFDRFKEALQRLIIQPLKNDPYPELPNYPDELPTTLFANSFLTKLTIMGHTELTCDQDIREVITNAIASASGMPHAFVDSSDHLHNELTTLRWKCFDLYREMTFLRKSTAEIHNFTNAQSKIINEDASLSEEDKRVKLSEFLEAPHTYLTGIDEEINTQVMELAMLWKTKLESPELGMPADAQATIDSLIKSNIDSTVVEQRDGPTTVPSPLESALPQIKYHHDFSNLAQFTEAQVYHFLLYIGVLATKLSAIDLSAIHLERATAPAEMHTLFCKRNLIIRSILESSAQHDSRPVVRLTQSTHDALTSHPSWSEFNDKCSITIV
jgi:GTP-binding protein EngB required for normal cell division